METDEIKEHLRELGIAWTHFFSVSDYLIAQGEHVTWSDEENPWFEEKAWLGTKGMYCKEQGIDMHIDDSETYGAFFETLYVRVI